MVSIKKEKTMPFVYNINKEERQQILNWAAEGIMYSEIARRLDNKITKQRVKQICAKEGIDSKKIRNERQNLEFETKMVAKWGKEWNKESVRRSYLYQTMRAKFRSKKANATRLGIEFTINFGDIDFPTHCPILGIELDYFSENGWSENSPSFDRLNSFLGYVKGNVAIISMRANRLKNNGTAEEHEKIAKFMRNASLP
jgi:hypothetical protein